MILSIILFIYLFIYLFTFLVVLFPQFFYFDDECLTLNRGKSINVKLKEKIKLLINFQIAQLILSTTQLPNKKVLTINIKGFRIMISKGLEFSSKHSKLTRACKNV